MSNIIVYAHLLHRTATRLRIRVPGRRCDLGFFQTLKQKLQACEGVTAVEVNPLTSSVLIVHGGQLPAATLRACGIQLAGDGHSSGGDHGAFPFSYSNGVTVAQRNGFVQLSLIAKLFYAAMTGRLGAQIFELVLEWLAEAVINAVFSPKKRLAGAVLVADLPGSRRQRYSFAAAA